MEIKYRPTGKYQRASFEFHNIGEMPVVLYPLQRIARISLFKMMKAVESYSGKFHYSFTPKTFQFNKDKDIIEILNKFQQIEKEQKNNYKPFNFSKETKK